MDYQVEEAEVDEGHLRLIAEKLRRPPQLLTISEGSNGCCIFRVPPIFHEINGKSYKPQTVSIGPYHRGMPHLEVFEEHKWVYLGSMLNRIRIHGIELRELMRVLRSLEREARECYSEVVSLEGNEFLEMLLVDGCFIIELFRKVSKLVSFDENDPIFTMPWVMPFLARDFLKLENQIPYFVLEKLFDLTRAPSRDESRISLSLSALFFFDWYTHRPEKVILGFDKLKGKHLLDFIRMSYIEGFLESSQSPSRNRFHQIFNVTKLRKAGIKVKKAEEESFLVVKFRKGILLMPEITIDDFMSSFLLNCVAYEQCQKGASKHFTSYTNLLDCLVNTTRDVEYLCDQNVLDNYFGSDEEVAHFINTVGNEISFSDQTNYLSEVFNDVHDYFSNKTHVQWAGFRYTYFRSPWSFISAFSAAILLLLTMAQTFYTIYGVYHK